MCFCLGIVIPFLSVVYTLGITRVVVRLVFSINECLQILVELKTYHSKIHFSSTTFVWRVFSYCIKSLGFFKLSKIWYILLSIRRWRFGVIKIYQNWSLNKQNQRLWIIEDKRKWLRRLSELYNKIQII